MKSYSIARRLITTVLLVELISAVCVTGMAWLYERHSHFRSFDILLRGRADSLLGSVQDAEDPEDNVMLSKSDVDVPSEDIYEVRDEKGRLLGRSPNWDGVSRDASATPADGYFNLTVGKSRYRALLLHGLRVVDPGDKGGGFHHVTAVCGILRGMEAVTRQGVLCGCKPFTVASHWAGVVAVERSINLLSAGRKQPAFRQCMALLPERRALRACAGEALEATLQRWSFFFSSKALVMLRMVEDRRRGGEVILCYRRQAEALLIPGGLGGADGLHAENIVAKMLTPTLKHHGPDLAPNHISTITMAFEQFDSVAELRNDR